MAKRFGGFTPEQMGKIIPEMAGMQADEQAKFLAASPSAAARVGKLAESAQKKIQMAQGGYIPSYANGGAVSFEFDRDRPELTMPEAPSGNVGEEPISAFVKPQIEPRPQVEPVVGRPQIEPVKQQLPEQAALDTAQQDLANQRTALTEAQKALAANPGDEALQAAVTAAEASVATASAGVSGASSALGAVGTPSITEANTTAFNDPSSMMDKAEVETISDADKKAGMIAEGTGDAGEATTGTVTSAEGAGPVEQPTATEANTYEPVEASEGVAGVMDRLEAVTGKPSDEALAEAATMDPDQLAQLGLTVAQIKEAQTVKAPDARTVQDGEMVEGSTVDMATVKKETNFQAATGAPSSDATVQGQLTGLMEQFEGSEPPAWAAGALRGAAAAMAARGLSSSSMAGQAMIQAAMESAMPIAVQDATTAASFEKQNLSNKQQAAMFAAEQRSKFLELDFNQEFQSRVINASKISDIANMNFTAEQQIALENARMAQTVDITNLNAVNAKVMADAAAMTQLDLTNLNNRQQAEVQNAKSFLEIDMANLDNLQQTSVFKAQQNANALLSDQAAQNASAQFNATSQNQTDQFFATLATQVAQFNTAQTNAMSQFNAGEANAMSQFNTAQKNARDQFNAQNHLVIAQANAQWSQTITTTENAAANQANRDQTLAANNLTMTAYNNLLQKERDLVSWAWQSGENSLDRASNLMIAEIEADADSKDPLSSALGSFTSTLLTNFAEKIIR